MTLLLNRLTLNLGHRDVRRDLGNAYDMHRTLARAFASGPDDTVEPFLWRLEASREAEPPTLLVQSQGEPRWEHLPAGYLQAQAQRSWTPEDVFAKGKAVAFRVRANPTVNRVPQATSGDEPASGSSRGRRKRLGLWREEEQLEWMQRQAERLGLGAVAATVSHAERLRCRRGGAVMTVATAQFDGQAVIADPDALAAGVRSGIGHARMLGLGLVSVAPLRA
ncbi:type I-E CRISPR-associated protein Cas6/Cse3/CasE [Vulcanococcus limneticus Candia 3F8]|uniref:type I-E CRISPR-associated protein Cas6/Cse3/CasE n=1 Tax=Vulcanococcus limneticus TaxID=2170428 RepID=UPI0020CB7EB5|nr:type I-E CRISPR-associated protein Cas6/Cse3/CasE [Vulcanococcus limneticus]MCP9793385.1 type I-E CRISPR-associated protein Cas6/Cse3/CasE [Vulcanococcus limneticus MW73D5]MCP9895533.1 type I-E CRISPR-associated protein Cas6/Cse3/CasE [Vulcanococcus limneticus Candia 3F8]MCP9898790.1 type I-E CRISPR-associated protein Cas6/Cse3/CasE [Vulcanococcus limneticus Candia 3B3]